MKKILTMLTLIGLAGIISPGVAFGAASDSPGAHTSWTNGVPPGTSYQSGISNYYNWNHSWSNYFNYSNDFAFGTNHWWRNMAQASNAPAPLKFQHKKQQVVGTQGRPEDRPRRAGQPEKPVDVQAMVQQFQQNRQTLMKQLKGASDEQRQQVLQQMEQLRSQMREQIACLREQALQQAEQMRTRLRNNRDRILNQGGNGNGGGGNGNGNGGADR